LYANPADYDERPIFCRNPNGRRARRTAWCTRP